LKPSPGTTCGLDHGPSPARPSGPEQARRWPGRGRRVRCPPSPAAALGAEAGAYRRHRPETAALYEVVRDNLETLYGAIEDGALSVRIPKHARKELDAYLDCRLLCRGFARLGCGGCRRSVLVGA